MSSLEENKEMTLRLCPGCAEPIERGHVEAGWEYAFCTPCITRGRVHLAPTTSPTPEPEQ